MQCDLVNPPKPETFFASEFDDFCKCCSYVSLEKGLGEKYFFFLQEVCFFGAAKNVYLGFTGYVSQTFLFV